MNRFNWFIGLLFTLVLFVLLLNTFLFTVHP